MPKIAWWVWLIAGAVFCILAGTYKALGALFVVLAVMSFLQATELLLANRK